MLHQKAIHYPSGYPMTRSPPFLVCSSPGPEPYRSHDNVYEELGPPRDSDGESDPPLHSDDDFAEDELSLPGDRSFHKSSPDTSTAAVSTIFNEQGTNSGNSVMLERSLNERNSLLSSASSTNDRSMAVIRNTASEEGGSSASGGGISGTSTSGPPTNSNGNNRCERGVVNGVVNGTVGALFRPRKSHQGVNCNTGGGHQHRHGTTTCNQSDTQNSTVDHNGASIANCLPTIYNERNMMTLPYNHNNHSISSINNNNNLANNNNTNNNRNDEVERLNQLNNQLSSIGPQSVVSTIFGRTNNTIRAYPPPYQSTAINQYSNNRSRTNPRSLDRRRIGGIPSTLLEPNYGYAEPIQYHDGSIVYDNCYSHHMDGRSQPPPIYPYIVPSSDYSSGYRTMNGGSHHHPSTGGHHQTPGTQHQLYSRDSSFGSDSGYSHHTQTSQRGSIGNSGSSSALGRGGFSWGRRKNKTNKNAAYGNS